jgi:PAS domain S-box-containing protein
MSDRLFGSIVEHAPACIALLRGPDFVFEVVNPAYAAIAPGVPMAGRRFAEVFPDAAPVSIPRMRRVLESGEPFRAEDQAAMITRRPGATPEPAWFSFSYTRVMDGETADSHSILILALETTARKRAEEERESAIAELQLQRRMFDTALSNTPDATYVFDCQGRFIYANRALLTRLRRSLADVVGKNFFELGYPRDLATKVHREIDELVRTRLPVHGETPLVQPEGSTRQYEYIFVPVISESGEVEAVAGSTRDITERKRAERREWDRQEQIRESARLESLGVMAGGIAHDFNNLLTGILGNASLLEETARDQDRPFASEIVLAAERAADLTRQMLAFAGKGRFVVEIVDLKTIIQDNLTLLRASLSRSVTFELAIDGEACFIEADRAQIQQIIMNLLINASEAIGEGPGKVTIRTGATERAEGRFSSRVQAEIPKGDYVLLEIGDNGIGMDADTVKRIFDPFFTTKFTGRGLGLAAVLGIVKGHRGDIEVVSQPGAGTTFKILLPRAASAGLQARRQETLVEVDTAPAANTGKTVLVVDDEEMVRMAAARALERQGHRVLIAANGAEALEILRGDSDVGLVVLDLTMPVMTGGQAIPLIKGMCPALPIILSSGFAEAEVSRRYADAGIADFLQKPYTAATIASKVRQIFQKLA